jgi:hypothetical protein
MGDRRRMQALVLQPDDLPMDSFDPIGTGASALGNLR